MKRNNPGISFATAFLLSGLAVLLLLAIPSAEAQRRQLERAENLRTRVLDNEFREEEAGIEDERAVDEEKSEADTTPLGVDVASIHLLAHQKEATMDPSAGSAKIVIAESLDAPDFLSAELESLVGQPLSMALLDTLNKTIVLAWRENEYPLVDVYFPEQNITLGKLQVVVREAVLGEKEVEGAVISKEEYLIEQMRVAPGDRINRRLVESDLDWLNENPIRQVNLIYEKGDADGTSDIVLDVNEEDPIRVYSGFANTGVEQTGEEEWSFGFNWGNPFGREQIIGYNFSSDVDFDNLRAHSVYYQAFLPWRHSLRLIGAHVSSESDATGLLGIEGESKQLTAEYRIPLTRPKFNRRWRHYFIAAFDYKSTNTDLLFGGSRFFGSNVEIGQFRAAYEVGVPDKLGYTRFAVGVVGSPGNMFSDNQDLNFELARVGSEADYAYTFLEGERLWYLPQDFSLRLDLKAQAGGDRLNSTEQLLAGGYDSVRGFDESIIRGDSGVVTSLELISPDFSVGEKLGLSLRDSSNWFAFYDVAALDISDPLPGEQSPFLQSIGLGLNCRISDRGFARASYGWALDSHGVDPAAVDSGKFHFGVTLTY